MARDFDIDGGGQTLVYTEKANGDAVSLRSDVDGTLLVEANSLERIVDIYMTNQTGTATIDGPTIVGAVEVDFLAGHGISTGDLLDFRASGIGYQQVKVLSVATNKVTIDTPIQEVWPIDTPVLVGSESMTVNGAIAPVIFSLAPLGTKVDVTRLIVHIEADTAMDTSTFGGITSLTNGIVFRVKRSNTQYWTLFNIKNNGEFSERAYDVEYTSKAPAGFYGMGVRRSFAGADKSGAVIRIDGALGEEVQMVIQDDLTDLTKFVCVLQGHIMNETT